MNICCEFICQKKVVETGRNLVKPSAREEDTERKTTLTYERISEIIVEYKKQLCLTSMY